MSIEWGVLKLKFKALKTKVRRPTQFSAKKDGKSASSGG
jgi:hypothetical protein